MKLSINKDQLAELPQVIFPGNIVVIDELKDIHNAIEVLKEAGCVGIDTETGPSFKKGVIHKVALLQISTENKCFLFRLNKLGAVNELKLFFEDKNVIKIGLSLKDDIRILKQIIDFEPTNFIDLQNMVKDYSIADNSLQKIYAIVFNERVSKGQRLTNWEALELTPRQLSYAAIDAWSCLKIYQSLSSGEFNPNKSIYIEECKEQN